MPRNKNAYIRHRLIDSLLRDKDYVKTNDIIDRLYERHDISVGSTTINKDIRDMQLELHAPIKYSNQKKAYYYPDDVDDIFPAIELKSDELNALLFYTKNIAHYKDIGIFKDFTNAIDKVIDAVKIEASQQKASKRIIIQPENFPKFQGSELIPEIIAGFDTNFKFNFDYKKHNSEEIKNHTVTPILLKEYDHLWYLIGKIEGKEFVTIFALDRIINFELTDVDCEEITGFDSDKYFNHAFGISVPDGEVEDVILEFDAWRGKYLLSSPIHKSQELIKEENGKLTFSFKVVPFHELHSKILSYGSSVKVLEPESLRSKIKEMLNNTLEKY
ncbi:helix-turn-helix transcriptional regulator [Winogradskyella helgolandensis]|uniref:helix-turn-helix transcriptional regulator n=1 Tax=Winogradskyella helgolandensis TaxID=2697010 RepID=UPI0015CA24CE|nr:WYL domain-containing protein [Winogradskyella helgolandensis]